VRAWFSGRLWSHRDFKRLWFSDTVSQFGNQFTTLALPILAVLSLHASAFELGILLALQTIPFPTLGLFVGVWADRLRKRPIMVICNFGRMVTLASIPVTYFLSTLTLNQLFAVAAVNGVFTVFFEISYQSYLPVLIDRVDLVEGNAKLQASASGAQVVGPGIAGIVYQLIGGALTIAVDAVGYLASVLALFSIRKNEQKRTIDPQPNGTSNFFAEMREGVSIVFRNSILWRLMSCTATLNFGGAIGGAVFVIFLLNMLKFSPALIGIVGTVGAVGFFLGTILTPNITKRIGLGPSIALSSVISVITMLSPLALFGAAFPIIAGVGFITGLALPVYNINQVSLRQTIVPDRLQGRMNATFRTVNWGTLPVGSIIGGILGTYLGIVPTILFGGAITGLGVLWVVAGEVLGLKEIPKVELT
jgi:MFS family permease